MPTGSRMENTIGQVRADEAVFASLYPELRRFAAVVSPREFDPDDLVQDALERTLRRHSLSTLTSAKAYLFRVMLNLASNQRRGLSRARRALARVSVVEERAPVYPSDVSELLRLPSSQRAILYLREVEGFTSAEVANLLGMTVEAVAKASLRARKRLSFELREEER